MKKYVGKKIMACEPIFQFSTGKYVYTRRRSIGVIEEISDHEVKVFSKSNPEGYRHYILKRQDFNQWVESGVYLIK